MNALGLAGHVKFIGRIPQGQIGQLYGGCDVMVYPSLCESFGFSMLEALGHDLPIVASDTDLNREICGKAALYYSPLEASDAARALSEVMDAERREELARNARERFESFDWSWRRYAREFSQLLDAAGTPEVRARPAANRAA